MIEAVLVAQGDFVAQNGSREGLGEYSGGKGDFGGIKGRRS